MNFDVVVLYYLFFFVYGLIFSFKAGKPATFVTISFFLEMPITGRMLEIW